MRISDWSSDVCSSDLRGIAARPAGAETRPRSVARRSPIGRPIDRRPDIVVERAVERHGLDEEDRGEPVRGIDPEQRRRRAVPEKFADRAAILCRRLRRRLAHRKVEAESDRPLARQPDRKSVVSGKSVSVRVDLGGRRIIKKKKYIQMKKLYR